MILHKKCGGQLVIETTCKPFYIKCDKCKFTKELQFKQGNSFINVEAGENDLLPLISFEEFIDVTISHLMYDIFLFIL